MDKKLTMGSLFAGIGGFDLGFELSGFDIKWCVEKDKNCQKTLKKNFPNAKIYGDISSIREEELEKVDVVCGGFPCQDLSVAGKRKGLAGERSGLFYEAIRLVRDIKPEFLILENVPGLLSSNKGLDFAAVIREMDQGWDCKEIGWRILDSRYFGVPQRRKRIFIVGSSRIGGAEQILSIPEGVRGNTAPLNKKGEKIASSSSGDTGDKGKDAHGFESIVIDRAAFNQGENALYEPRITEADEMPTLVSKGPHAVAFRKSRRAQSSIDDETWVDDGIANTLNGFDVGDTRTTHAILSVDKSSYSNIKDKNFDATSFDGMNQKVENQMHHSLRTGRDSGDFVAITKSNASNMIIRRLTPVECERLQGFPDGWTNCNSDAVRYKQLGNAVTVNVAQWIAKNTKEFLENAKSVSENHS